MYLAGGYEGKEGERIRRTRIPLEEFVAAIRLGSSGEGRRVENDEVECLLANMIYKVRHSPFLSLSPGWSFNVFSTCHAPLSGKKTSA